jgi:hypothetical protein
VEVELLAVVVIQVMETVELEDHGLEMLQIMLEVAVVLVNQDLVLDREEPAAEVPEQLVLVQHLEMELTV